MNTPSKKSSMTPEEIRQKLDCFYTEVEKKEQSDGILRHVDSSRKSQKSLKEKIMSLFRKH